MDKDRSTELLYALAHKLAGEFQEKGVPNFVRREASFPNAQGKVHVALGMRRVGKTYFLYQKISDLMAQGVPLSRLLYLNMEDDRLLPLTARELGALIDAYYSLYPENHDNKCFLFLDEIQNVDGWPLVVRRLLDTKKIEIYLSGSSAKLLSREIATELRGRALATEIWPFSWNEYLAAKEISKPTRVIGTKQQDFYLKHLRKYLITGGFPEIVDFSADVRLSVLQEYTHTVIYRDIVERHNITNLTVLKNLIKVLLKSISARFSAHKCFKDFKSQGLVVSKNTILDYLEHIKDAYLAFDSLLFTESIRRQNSNPRKIYSIDTGLSLANTFNLSENWGALFENLIYTDLRRHQRSINYYATDSGLEVDFVSRSIDGKLKLYQACWDMGDERTRERENNALTVAAKELKIKGRVVTPLDYIPGGWI